MATRRNFSKSQVSIFFFCALLAASGSAISGSIARSNVPSDPSGQYLSCSNESAPLVLMREKGATTLFQRAQGRDVWRMQLPPMAGDRDEFILSPDGSAAIVTTNPRTGDAWLIGQGRKVAMPGANVLTADFQQHLALVVGSIFTGGRLTGFEFAVWDLRNMKRTHTHRTDDMLSVTVDRPFYARLTPDGTAYYYVAATAQGGERLVMRSAATGREIMLPRRPQAKGSIDDALVGPDGRMRLILGGKLYIENSGHFELVVLPEELGVVATLVESPHGTMANIQGVIGKHGWGLLNVGDRRWLLSERGGYMQAIWNGDVFTAYQRDIKGLEAHRVRVSALGKVLSHRPAFDASARNVQSVQCVNAYGYATDSNGRLAWTAFGE